MFSFWPIEFLIAVWIACLLIILIRLVFNPGKSVGIVPLYAFGLTLSHLPAGLLHLSSSYSFLENPSVNYDGFFLSTIGIAGYTLGVTLIGSALAGRALHQDVKKENNEYKGPKAEIEDYIPDILVALGLLAYFILVPVIGRLPTLNAFTDGLRILFPIGLILIYRRARNNSNRMVMLFVIFIIAIWPLFTIITSGFLSFGAATSSFVGAYIFLVSKKNFITVAVALLILYIFISFGVTYFANRDDLREAVWNQQETGTTEDAETTINLLSDFQLFSLQNDTHLSYIDIRSNYNFYAGSVVNYMDEFSIPYAYGQTIRDAFLMLIPRIIWTDKPLEAGGDELLVRYAGIDLHGGTSASPGHIGQAYINFSIVGIFVFMMIYGVILSVLDRRAVQASDLDELAFAVWLAPCVALMSPELALLENVSGAVSGFLVVATLSMVIKEYIMVRRTTLRNILSSQASARRKSKKYA